MSRRISYNVSPARVAQILRQARDLMNNGGKHWVKGDLKVDVAQVNEDTKHIEYLINPTYKHLPNYRQPTGEFAFCSIGSVYEVTQDADERMAVLMELGLQIYPGLKECAIEAYEDDFYYLDDPNMVIPEPELESLYSYGNVEDVIADANDANTTTWNDVRDWFTMAAKRVAQRKG